MENRKYTIEGKEVTKAEFLEGIKAGKSGVDAPSEDPSGLIALRARIDYLMRLGLTKEEAYNLAIPYEAK